MNCSEVNWNLDYDGDDFEVKVGDWTLKGQSWTKNVENPKFIYVFVHGLTATIVFKKDIYPVINGAGGVVFACDHVGHGRSPGAPVSCMISENVEETKQVIQIAQQRFPDLPVILHGHSMGGLTVLSLALRYPDFVSTNVKAIIAEAPWISPCPQRVPGCCLMALTRVASKIPVLSTLGVPSGVNFFTDDEDPTWRDLTQHFKYNYSVLTPRLYVSVVDEIAYVRSNVNRFPKDVFLLFIQGKKDDLVDPEMNEAWIQKLLSYEDYSRVFYKKFEDAPHVILKTKDRSDCLHSMLSFIQNALQTNDY